MAVELGRWHEAVALTGRQREGLWGRGEEDEGSRTSGRGAGPVAREERQLLLRDVKEKTWVHTQGRHPEVSALELMGSILMSLRHRTQMQRRGAQGHVLCETLRPPYIHMRRQTSP